jgi:23S rRNA (guanosine2251-2'-O)-methyltransferase
MSEVIYGVHAIGEALKRGGRRFDYVAVSRDRADKRLQQILDDCRDQGISVRFVPREDIDRQTRTNTHQGIMAFTSRKEFTGVEELLEHPHGDYNFLLVLDGVEDPHNLGALLRSADGAGVDGVVIPERRAAGITGTVVKTSAGASEHLHIARVVNIARTLDELKDQNVWIVGLDERGTQSYDQLDYKMNCAIVLGAEGKGLHDLVRRKCDMLVSIPMMGAVSSLNVSVAGAIVMYEVQRQRRQAAASVAANAAKPAKPARKRIQD